jgi:hypothetical protein
MKRRNPKRAAKTFARNFGERGAPVRAMGCLCAKYCADWYFNTLQAEHANGTPERFDASELPACSGPIQACHTIARGMGGAKGDRRNLVPLCAHHHTEAGERGTSQREAFEKRYGLDLQAEAKRIAEQLDGDGFK